MFSGHPIKRYGSNISTVMHIM